MSYANTQTGWRLPNVKEIQSISDKTQTSTKIDPNVFPNTAFEFYWTSTPLVGFAARAWFGNFRVGGVNADPRSSTYPIRLVRQQ